VLVNASRGCEGTLVTSVKDRVCGLAGAGAVLHGGRPSWSFWDAGARRRSVRRVDDISLAFDWGLWAT
jgi:hypothetical protein